MQKTLEQIKSEIDKAQSRVESTYDQRQKEIEDSYRIMGQRMEEYEERKKKYEVIDQKLNKTIDQMLIDGKKNNSEIKNLLDEMMAVYETR